MQLRKIILAIVVLLVWVAVDRWGTPQPTRDQFAACQAEPALGVSPETSIFACMRRHGYALDIWRLACFGADSQLSRAECYSPIKTASKR